jgi:hypothetical protein
MKGVCFQLGFPPFSFTVYSTHCRNCKTLLEFKEMEIYQGKSEELTLNNKEENSSDFCLYFVREFGLCRKCCMGVVGGAST